MMRGKGLAGVAIVMLVLGSAARADDIAGTDSEGNPVSTPASSVGPTRGPLMAGLDQIGVGPVLDKANITLGGYIEGGYLYDMSVPGDTTPAKSAPGDFILFPGDIQRCVHVESGGFLDLSAG